MSLAERFAADISLEYSLIDRMRIRVRHPRATELVWKRQLAPAKVQGGGWSWRNE